MFPVRNLQWVSLILLLPGFVIPGSALAQGTGLDLFPTALADDVSALPSWENTWWLLGGAGLTLLVHQIEDPDGAQRALDQGLIDSLADFGNIWGDVRLQAPLALGCWFAGSQADNDKLARVGFDLSRSLLLTYGVTSAFKLGVDRTRPNGQDFSFPSGHSASAFSTAGVIWGHYGSWAGGTAVGLGVLTTLGRMEDRKHFASDVAAGATIGWIIGRTAARQGTNPEASVQLVPLGRGVALAGRF